MIAFSYKRILMIVGFVALTILFASLLYLLFFRSPTAPPANEIITPDLGQLPSVGPGKPPTPPIVPSGLPPIGTTTAPTEQANGGITQVKQLVATETAAPAIENESLLYYQPTDGRFYRITPEGRAETLTDQIFHDVNQVTWSPNRNLAVLEYPDGSNIVYNFQTKTQATLPKHWEEFSFDPDGDKLAFKSMGLDRESRWLAVSDANGGRNEAIEALGDNTKNVTVDWSPNRQIVAYVREVLGTDRQELFFIGLNNENFRSLKVPGLGLRTQWTPDGQSLLYSASSPANDYKPLLWIADAAGENIGENRRSLGVNTWASKCAFAGADNIICAVPQELPAGSGLTPGVADTIPDNLYSINLSTGGKRLLAIPATPLTAESVMVTTDRRWIFLKEAITGSIYRIALP